MGRKGYAAVILLIVLFLVSLSLAGGGFYLLKKERAKVAELEENLEEMSIRQKATDEKLSKSERLVSELQAKFQEANLEIDDLNKQIAQERAMRQESLTKMELLKADLEQQKSLRLDLERRLNLAQEEAKRTTEQLKTLETQKREAELQKKEVEEKLKEIEESPEGVELGKIVVTPEAQEPKAKKAPDVRLMTKEPKKEASGLDGKVLVLNKDYNFVVISVGAKEGVATGDVFSIYHNNKFVGDVKVEKVHDSMAAAGFVNGGLKDKISEGDRAVRK